MKIEHLLAAYLYQYHRLSLRSIGVFLLNEKAHAENYVPHHAIPGKVIRFVQDDHTPADENVISFIIGQTGKMHSLAQADLETFISGGQQLINIHQPFAIEGIGSLHKDIQGRLHFTPGKYIPLSSRETHKSKQRTSAIAPARAKKRLWPALLLIAVIIAGGWWIYRHNIRHHPAPVVLTGDRAATTGPNTLEQQVSDSISSAMIRYNVVFEIADSARAFFRYHQLKSWGDSIIMYTNDSIRFFLAAPFVTMPADTAAIKDSIRILFGREVFIDIDS